MLEQIILVCKRNDYAFVTDFRWFVELLTNMTHLSSMGKANAELVAEQLLDVTIRVPEVRKFSVQQMVCDMFDDCVEGWVESCVIIRMLFVSV